MGNNNIYLKKVNVNEQHKAFMRFERQRQQNILKEEREKLLKMIQNEPEKQGSEKSGIFNLIEMFGGKAQNQKKVQKKFKTGFGMYYIRWCLNNPSFNFIDPTSNLPMNKIDYFKKWVWDSLSEEEKYVWLVRSFNKNNDIPDPEEERELEEIEKNRKKFENYLPEQKPKDWNNPSGGCNGNEWYASYRQNEIARLNK